MVVSVSDSFSMCGGVAWTYCTKGHRISVYISTRSCAAARLPASRDLCWSREEHVPKNKRLHLASQDRAQRVCLHVNESANAPRGEQTDSVLHASKMNLLLVAVPQR